ncbi:MAG: ABC transporter substrate-binding protein [Chloroflexota bacterium]|nr:ABC transporter substrate-binding protein [Chloroflexota bacterium]
MRPSSIGRGSVIALLAALLTGTGASAARAQENAAERVRLPFPAYDGTLTPYTFSIGYPLVTLVYDTLLWRDAEGRPRPWLARSLTRSNGGRRVTVRLRDGVRWHDGRPLTASDVAFTFRFMAARYHPRFTPQLRHVERVQATGRLTARIDLTGPSLGFDDQPLADLPILPRHRWQGLADGRAAPSGLPVGSGPYRLVRADPIRGYAFRANRGYFRGSPRVDEIRVPIIGDAQRTYDALRERNVDMVPLNLPQQPARELSSSLGIAVQRGPSYAGTMLVLNLRRPPFNRLAARQALASALNLERISGRAAPAAAAEEGFIHPASEWSPGTRMYRFDPTAANASRSELGTDPVRVLAPVNDPVRLEAGRQVVLALRAVGARAMLVERSRAQLDRALGVEGSAPTFTAAIETIPSLASYDPDYLVELFGSDPRIAPLNHSGYRSERFDSLARRVASAPDAATRRGAVRAELELLSHDLPAIPLFFAQGVFAYRAAIYDGWVFIKGTGILDKRSFLPGTTQGQSAPQASAVDASVRPDSESRSWLTPLNVISLAIVLVVVALAALALRQRRRDRML